MSKTLFERFTFEIPQNLKKLITTKEFITTIGYNNFKISNNFEILHKYCIKEKVFFKFLESIESKITISNIIDFELDSINGWSIGAGLNSLTYNTGLRTKEVTDFVFCVVHKPFEPDLKLLDNISAHNLKKVNNDVFFDDISFSSIEVNKYKCEKCGINIFSDFLKHKMESETKFYCKNGFSCEEAMISEIIE